MNGNELENARRCLCRLGDFVRDAVLQGRDSGRGGKFSAVAAVTPADTIYHADRIGEEAILAWLERRWPRAWPVELVMEGAGENHPLTFPRGTPAAATRWKCIVDPIDGTRNLMYDKRSAWVLAALAPQKGGRTFLSDIVAAAMTEIPTRKQWRADQISAVKGRGRKGLVAEMINIRNRKRKPLQVAPSRAADFRHGFASLARFFPEGKALIAKIEEDLWDELYGLGRTAAPLVFDDQYLCSGGQIYELLMGHDRMLGDLRPLVFKKLGFDRALSCHPYDLCAAMILTETGGVFEAPGGGPVRAKLDTTSPVAWMGYANEKLARQVRPVLKRLIRKYLA